MNVTLPEKNKITKKDFFIYTIIILICIASIITSIYVQIMETAPTKRGGALGEKEDDETELIKVEFNEIFSNRIENYDGKYDNKKAESARELVFTNYEKKESKTNSYDLEIHIPYINIKNETVEKYNQEIEDVFVKIARNVLQSENKNIIYTVEYVADVQDDILSVMIRSNLKEGSNAQKVIIQTYNYNLSKDKEMTLAEVIKGLGLDKQIVQSKINDDIEIEQKKSEDLKKLGYNIYNRDSSSDIYKIENSTEFYLKGSTLYIIYAYGNEKSTSEMDLIII